MKNFVIEISLNRNIKNVLNKIKSDVKSHFVGESTGHGYDHIIRVYNLAMKIAKNYNCDTNIIALAALLHDVDDHKLFNTKNNANARAIMRRNNIDDDTIEKVVNIISKISFSKGGNFKENEIEGKIVQDADRLDGIGAIGIGRTFTFGGANGRSLFVSLAHLDEKLFLVKDLMNTKEGKQMAEQRHDAMQLFYNYFRSEVEESR